jgi:hypothetical protein
MGTRAHFKKHPDHMTQGEKEFREEIGTMPSETGDYRRARGVLPLKPGAPLPEEIIRRKRDA